MNGRNLEYFGKDPFLAGKLVVPYIRGVQSKGVAATVKVLIANNSEFNRHDIDIIIDERPARELYLPAFEAAVKEGHVAAVMDSYNLVNGEHSSQNSHLNNEILKHEWGFDGIVMSDWGGTYDSIGAANGGLDLEMATGRFMNPKKLMPAIQSGQVSEATIDDKVRRFLRNAVRYSFLKGDQLDLSIPLYSQKGREVALEGARESIVLLKNEAKTLPLDRDRIQTLAVIGPDAFPAVPGGGGSSNTTAFAPVSILTGVSDALAPKVRVLYARGLPTIEELANSTRFEGGLKKEIFSNAEFAGPPLAVGSETLVSRWKSEQWTGRALAPRSIRWTGTFVPVNSGPYLFLVAAGGEDRYRLTMNGRLLLEWPGKMNRTEGQAPQSVEVPLTALQKVSIQLDYVPDADYERIGFAIRAVDKLVSSDASKLAASADAAVVSVGFDQTNEGEGYDRTFALPYGQDALISAIATANKNTIVTVTAGGAVDMTRWLAQVPVVLHTWYPGQEGGRAVAEILFGERSPEGHLPMSFERAWTDNPTHDNYYPKHPTAKNPQVRYSEGLMLGYRYYTSTGKKPLFPFGYGLSYTSFSFSHLKVDPAEAHAGTPIKVSFDVQNTGACAGAEVAQLYVGDPSARVERPARELKGFEKVRLAPGETKHVVLRLDKRALSYYNVEKHGWQVDPGRFNIYVGDSSENTPLTASFIVER